MKEQLMDLARILIMHSVSARFEECGNSYSNANLKEWLEGAILIGSYCGRTTGNIRELEYEWEDWLENNGGLPEIPEMKTK